MAKAFHRLSIDLHKSLAEQPENGHNRWHPAIKPRLHVNPGDRVVIETLDAVDGQITLPDPARNGPFDVGRVHPLTGPVYIRDAEPGDLLEVQIIEIEPATSAFTNIAPAMGFLREDFLTPFIAIWRLANGFAESPQVPGVRIPAACFPGVIGVAPSYELLKRANDREQKLRQSGGVALPPERNGAVPATDAIASEGLRTIPPRENAGNVDIKQLTAGARVFIPVWEQGALFSIGDGHFAQGDSECCGTAIEMAAAFHLDFYLSKGEAARRKLRDLSFAHDRYFTAPEMAVPRRFYATTGMPLTAAGENRADDLALAARNAVRHMIDYLHEERGYSREQAYVICSVAVDLRISQVVDVPNFTVSALLPLDIFV
jgi:formamidase